MGCRLADGGDVKVTRVRDTYIIELAKEVLQPINTIVEIQTAKNVMDIPPFELASQPLPVKQN